MSKVELKACDACGLIATKFQSSSSTGFWPRKIPRNSYSQYVNADLCSSCASAFRAFMKGASSAQKNLSEALSKCGLLSPDEDTVTKKKPVKRKR